MNPDDLLRLAALLKLQGETVRLFSDTLKGGNGKSSRITSLAIQIEEISGELTKLAKGMGACDTADEGEP